MFGAVHLVAHYAWLNTDKGASMVVQQYHFPSDATIPSTAAAREVYADSPAAHQLINDRLKNAGSDSPAELEKFGLGLHPLQDSWSHCGIPDIPDGRDYHAIGQLLPKISW